MAQERRLRRFFSSVSLPPAGGGFQLACEEVRHLRQILRLQPGDECLVTDGRGREIKAVIRQFNEDGTASLVVLQDLKGPDMAAGTPVIRIFQAIPRGTRFDFLVQKAQELELSALVPMMSERTVVQILPKKTPPKLERWNRIAREAAKQSGSRFLLEIHPPLSLKACGELIAEAEEVAVFHPGGNAGFRRWIEQLQEKPSGVRRINLFLGPEGGFSDKEITWLSGEAAARGWRFSVVDLGGTILRIETAFLAVSSSLKLFLQE